MSTDLSADGIDPNEWKSLHPLTFLPRIAGGVAGMGASMAWLILRGNRPIVAGDVLVWAGGAHAIALFAVAVPLVVGAAALWAYMSWRMTRYAITPTAVWFRSGILSRSQRHARLTRIQTVNLSYSLVGRILGLGSLDIEVAGGADSQIKLGLLSSRRLHELRALILALASGSIDEVVDSSEPNSRRDARPTIGLEVPERRVFTVGFVTLLASMLATFDNALALFFGLGLIVLNTVLVGVLNVTSIMSFLGILTGAVSLLVGVWARFDREFGFTAAIAADGVRISRGLTARRHVTIPPGRIHALQVTQPLVWRLFGWYRVEITQAGTASTTDSEKNEGVQIDAASDLLLPVGSRAEVAAAIAMAIPDLGVDNPEAFLESLRAGTRGDRWMTPIPSSARILDPLAYRRRAFALTDAVFAIRDGFVNRRFSIIALSRIQSLSLRQGPTQRWRRVASVRAELVPGRVASVAQHVEATLSLTLCQKLATASKIRREAEAPERWLSRVTEIVEARAGQPENGE